MRKYTFFYVLSLLSIVSAASSGAAPPSSHRPTAARRANCRCVRLSPDPTSPPHFPPRPSRTPPCLAGGRRAARRRGGGGGGGGDADGCDYPKDGSSFITSDTALESLVQCAPPPPTPVSRSSSETRLSHELEFDDSGSTNNHISPGAEESPGITLPAPALSAPQPPPCCCSKVYPKRSMSACMYCATIRRVWSS